jgi:hypothetical protein
VTAPRLVMRAADHKALLEHLLQNKLEQAAFGYARVKTEAQQDFMLEHMEFVPPEGFAFQSEYHIEIAGEILGAAIKSAWDRGLALVEFHSHPFHYGTKFARAPEAEFSASDLSGFEEWVPHVQWRLKHQQPYLAIVFSPNSFDALMWKPHDAVASPRPLASIQLDNGLEFEPTGFTLHALQTWRKSHDDITV